MAEIETKTNPSKELSTLKEKFGRDVRYAERQTRTVKQRVDTLDPVLSDERPNADSSSVFTVVESEGKLFIKIGDALFSSPLERVKE